MIDVNLQEENQRLASILHSMIPSSQPVVSENVISFDDDTTITTNTTEVKSTIRQETLDFVKEIKEEEQTKEMQNLFDDQNINSFSLFNFLPNTNTSNTNASSSSFAFNFTESANETTASNTVTTETEEKTK